MEKEIVFLIWLYDKEKEYSGDLYSESLVEEIREKYCDLFSINEKISEANTR